MGAPRWYSVGRVNYSRVDKKIADLVTGFEYDAGCWVGRVVVERLQTSNTKSNRRILFQLEFVGFSRLGASPIKTLSASVPRYQYLRQDIQAPSRFSKLRIREFMLLQRLHVALLALCLSPVAQHALAQTVPVPELSDRHCGRGGYRTNHVL